MRGSMARVTPALACEFQPGRDWTSVITTCRAPACFATAAPMMPIGPAPVTRTSSPNTGNSSAGVHGITERVEDTGDIGIERMLVNPDIGHGQRDVFGKGAGAVNAHAARAGAEMAASREAVTAASANHVALSADELAREKVGDICAYFDNFAHEFVAHHHGDRNGPLGPLIPLVDVDIGAADGGLLYLNENVVNADRGDRNIFQPESGFGFTLYQRFHEFHGTCLSLARLGK